MSKTSSRFSAPAQQTLFPLEEPVALAEEAALHPDPESGPEPPKEDRGLRWVFIGSQGLRAGWSVAVFLLLWMLLVGGIGAAATFLIKKVLHYKSGDFTAVTALIQETIMLSALLGAALLVARMEGRSLLDYNLKGGHRLFHFSSGLVVGFLAISTLVMTMVWGGWLQFGPVALNGAEIFRYAALWGGAFLLTGLFEEGGFRCYLQFTLARGINFLWAVAVVAGLCIASFYMGRGEGVWGMYFIAGLGALPCFLLHASHYESSGFWQASWVTSALFGFVHTGNNGENWIGIFAAGAIGFVFCVSIRLTGSAWWAIGCHAAWDWAETYFYGTNDSGLVAVGHYMTTTPVGNTLWSGGTDGPEGSLLVIPVIVLLLLLLMGVYGHTAAASALAASPAGGSRSSAGGSRRYD